MEVNHTLEISRFATLRSRNASAGPKNQRVVFPPNFQAARQRQTLPVLPALCQLQDRSHMRGVELTLARLQLANDPPHHPSADSKVLLCALCALCVLCGEIFLP